MVYLIHARGGVVESGMAARPSSALIAALVLAMAAATAAVAPPGTAAAAPPTAAVPLTAAATAASAATWPAYHHDAARSGVGPTTPSLLPPQSAWTAHLDGDVYGEPLVANGLVVVATENDTVYGLAAGNGSVAWSTHLGTPVPLSSLPCGDIDPLGITSTPVLDPAINRVFVLAEEQTAGGGVQHELVGLDAASGAVAFRRIIDPPGMDPVVQQQRARAGLVVRAGGGRLRRSRRGLRRLPRLGGGRRRGRYREPAPVPHGGRRGWHLGQWWAGGRRRRQRVRGHRQRRLDHHLRPGQQRPQALPGRLAARLFRGAQLGYRQRARPRSRFERPDPVERRAAFHHGQGRRGLPGRHQPPGGNRRSAVPWPRLHQLRSAGLVAAAALRRVHRRQAAGVAG